jgi:hypothetical protein
LLEKTGGPGAAPDLRPATNSNPVHAGGRVLAGKDLSGLSMPIADNRQSC